MSDKPAELPARAVLRRAVDEVLVETLSLPLRATIRRLLANGTRASQIRTWVHEMTGGPTQPGTGLIYLQVDAYLDRLAAEHPQEDVPDA